MKMCQQHTVPCVRAQTKHNGVHGRSRARIDDKFSLVHVKKSATGLANLAVHHGPPATASEKDDFHNTITNAKGGRMRHFSCHRTTTSLLLQPSLYFFLSIIKLSLSVPTFFVLFSRAKRLLSTISFSTSNPASWAIWATMMSLSTSPFRYALPIIIAACPPFFRTRCISLMTCFMSSK